MRRSLVRGAALVALTALVACRKDRAAGQTPTPDAGLDAGSAQVVAPVPMTLLASRAPVTIVPKTGTRSILALAGLYVYELTDDGEVRRLGGPEAYKALLKDDVDDLVGYDAVAYPYRALGLFWSEGNVILSDLGGEGSHLVWRDGAFVKSGNFPFEHDSTLEHGLVTRTLREGEPVKNRPTNPLPDGFKFRQWTRTRSGAVVLLGRQTEHGLTSAIAQGNAAATIVPIGTNLTGCDLLHALDGEVYLGCRAYLHGYPVETRIYRLDGDIWKNVYLRGLTQEMSFAVLADGTVVSGDYSGNLTRYPRGKEPEVSKLPAPVVPPITAYASEQEDLLAKDGSVRRWTHVEASSRAPGTERLTVEQLLPTPDGTLWVTARDGMGMNFVVRVGAPIRPRPITPVGTEVDQENEIRVETRPARRWVGHCPQIFVALPRSVLGDAGAGIGDPALGKVLADARESAVDATVLDGRLDKRRVFGVLLARRSSFTDEKAFEAIAEKFVARYTSSAANPAQAFCSAPILDTVYPR